MQLSVCLYQMYICLCTHVRMHVSTVIVKRPFCLLFIIHWKSLSSCFVKTTGSLFSCLLPDSLQVTRVKKVSEYHEIGMLPIFTQIILSAIKCWYFDAFVCFLFQKELKLCRLPPPPAESTKPNRRIPC